MKKIYLFYSLVILSSISFLGGKLSWEIVNTKSDNGLMSMLAILLFVSVSLILPFLNTLIFSFNISGKKPISDKIFSSLIVLYGTVYLICATIIGYRHIVSELIYENREIGWISLGMLNIIISLYKKFQKL